MLPYGKGWIGELVVVPAITCFARTNPLNDIRFHLIQLLWVGRRQIKRFGGIVEQIVKLPSVTLICAIEFEFIFLPRNLLGGLKSDWIT